MIIGVAGFAGSGKDTVGRYLVEHYNFERRGFADKLKEAYEALFDLIPGDADKFKNEENVHVAIGYENRAIRPINRETSTEVFVADAVWSPITTFTVRESLQRFGTEMGRKVFGEDFWVELALPYADAHAIRRNEKNIVMTDCRFPNEVEKVRRLKGYIIWIESSEGARAGRNVRVGGAHESEMRLTPDLVDFTIDNDSSLAHLYNEVENTLDAILARRANDGR